MRFRDNYPVFFIDENGVFNEQDHPRDKDGKFSSGRAKGAGKSEKRKYVRHAEGQELSKISRVKKVDYYINQLLDQKVEDKSEVINELMETEIRGGKIQCNIPEYGPQTLSIGKNFCGETLNKLWRTDGSEEEQLMFCRTAVALYRIDEVVKYGNKSAWSDSYKHNKHKDEEFLYIKKALVDTAGKKFNAVATLKRFKKQTPSLYLMKSENSSQTQKMAEKRKVKDGEMPKCELVSVDVC